SSMEDYKNSKKLLFNQSKIACINLDDAAAEEFIMAAQTGKHTTEIITFGESSKAMIRAKEIENIGTSQKFTVNFENYFDFVGEEIKLKSSNENTFIKNRQNDNESNSLIEKLPTETEFEIGMTGRFNVSNALCAISMSLAAGLPLEHIKSGLASARAAGRMEIFIRERDGLIAIVDYAHNKMSMEALFDSTRKEYPDREIRIVFGCPGYKAQGRRKELGEIAGKYAVKSYLAEEDHGEEPIRKISEEIAEHIKEGRKEYGDIFTEKAYEFIDDREEAIKKAVEESGGNTVILITAKGRETRQKRGVEYIETVSDVEIVERLFQK
ncbi:MAG: glutamate ligase domain-containing protein, partial [Anaerovoracaceae bacterium]